MIKSVFFMSMLQQLALECGITFKMNALYAKYHYIIHIHTLELLLLLFFFICERLLSNNHTNSKTQTESVHFIVRNLTMIKSHKNGHNIKIIIPIYHPNRQSSSNDKRSICIQLFVALLCFALLFFCLYFSSCL